MKNVRRVFTVLLVVAVLFNLAACGKENAKSAGEFEYWNECDAITGIKAYVAAVTDERSGDFIPVCDRIAVFDMGGTLACETYYTYYDTMMFIEYCLVDHPDKVSDELKEVASSIKPGYLADENLARNFAKAYAGMTLTEFADFVTNQLMRDTDGFTVMINANTFYLPMIEVVEYLQDNVLTVLSPVRKVQQYAVDYNGIKYTTDKLINTVNKDVLLNAQAYYQWANLYNYTCPAISDVEGPS